jgi:hypothetical protein
MQNGRPERRPFPSKISVRFLRCCCCYGSTILAHAGPAAGSGSILLPVPECSQCSRKHHGEAVLCEKCDRSNKYLADRARKLRRDALQSPPPDPAPCRRLRRSLARCRASGEDFDTAWSIATEEALRGAEDGWAPVLKWSRHEWRAAYHRQPNGTSGDFSVLEPLSAA